MKLSWVEEAKRRAVLKAIEPIKNGWIIGLGSGSTVTYAVKELARLRRDRRFQLSIVPTSYQMEHLCISNGLTVTSLSEVVNVDYAIDGADQVQEGSLSLVKGGGAALLREKLVDTASRQLAIVVDETKLSKHLGGKQPIPLEVLPLGYKYVQSAVAKMGGRAKLRESLGKAGPVITDNGNFILDADFGKVQNPNQLDRQLKAIPGLLETGFFTKLKKRVYVGLRSGGVKILTNR